MPLYIWVLIGVAIALLLLVLIALCDAAYRADEAAGRQEWKEEG